jgi:hypothetical protein
MTRFAFLSVALLLAVPAAAQDKDPSAGAPSPKLENLLQNCDAHKFETTVESTVNGEPHRSKVKMCGTEGQSDADWIGTLNDAIAKLEANKTMPADTRDQIVTAIRTEIARLNAPSTPNANATLPPGRSASSAPQPLTNDYSVLPPLPSTTPPPARVLPPAAEAASAAASPAIAAPPKPAIVNPRLGFSCMNPDYPGGGPCVTLTRDTVVTVRAPEAVPGGISLRFVRQGDARAEVALGAMRKGGTVRLSLPQPVCSGVVTSEVVMQVVGGGQVFDRQGPYLLRC